MWNLTGIKIILHLIEHNFSDTFLKPLLILRLELAQTVYVTVVWLFPDTLNDPLLDLQHTYIFNLHISVLNACFLFFLLEFSAAMMSRLGMGLSRINSVIGTPGIVLPRDSWIWTVCNSGCSLSLVLVRLFAESRRCQALRK